MIKFGFEREFFVLDRDGNVAMVPRGIPHDGGLLAEARGEPYRDPIDAAFSLKAEVWKIRKGLEPHGLSLDYKSDCREVSPEMRLEARRHHTKDLIHYQNLYDDKIVRHPVGADEMTAGLHVSVTCEVTVSIETRPSRDITRTVSKQYNGMFDYARFIRAMDEAFRDTIYDARREEGFYEIKRDGRVEYRSLPQSTPILEVAHWLQDNVSLIHGSWA